MAHDIGWYRKQHKIWMEEKASYIAAAEQAQANIDAAVAARSVQLHDQYSFKINELDKRLTDARAEIAEVEHAKQLAYSEVTKLRVDVVDLKGSIHSQAHTIVNLEETIKQLRDELAAVQPTIDLERGKVEDLKKILDGHKDRLRRKDLENIAAIENRKVLAGAVPGMRRR